MINNPKVGDRIVRVIVAREIYNGMKVGDRATIKEVTLTNRGEVKGFILNEFGGEHSPIRFERVPRNS